MPVYAEWDDEHHTIIRLHIHDPWEMKDYVDASQTTQTLMKSVNYPVHLIIDLTHSHSFPKDVMSYIPTINSHILPNQGLVVAVRVSPYLQTLSRMVSRIFPRFGRNLRFTYTLKEAYALIQAHDQPATRR